jgi:maltose alpha-D-glucosyltransferase/alpha-amylase
MQWSTEPHAGFTRAAKPVLPVIEDGPYSFHQVNAADQRRDPTSMLNWTERLIRMRKEVPELGWGKYRVIDVKNPSVLVMEYLWRNNAVVTVHNLCDENLEITLPLKDKLISLFDGAHSEPDGRHRHHIILEPYGYRWYRVGGLGYILDRTNY